MSSSLKQPSQLSPDFTWDLLSKVLIIVQNGYLPLKKVAAMPIYGKTLKNLLLHIRDSFEAESVYIVLGGH